MPPVPLPVFREAPSEYVAQNDAVLFCSARLAVSDRCTVFRLSCRTEVVSDLLLCS